MAAPTSGPSKPEHHGLQGHIDPLGANIIPADWPAQAADQIVDTIATVRHKTTRPALIAARSLVYGIVLLVTGTVLGVLLITLVIRLYDVYVPGPIWPIYAALSAVFLVTGWWMLRQANKPATVLAAEADAAV